MRSSSVAVGSDGVVWAIDAATLEEVSTPSLTVLHRYALPLFGTTIALTPYGVTVAARGIGDGVARLAPGASAAKICWLGDAQQLVLDGQMMWASAAAGLTELDARTCRPVATTPAIDTGNSTDGIAVLPDQVWLAYESGDFQRIAKS
jgi:hypothetical protein